MGSKMYYSISLIVVTFSLLVMMTGPLTVQAADSGSNSGDGGGGSPDSGSGSGSNSGSDKGPSDNSNNNNNNNPPHTDKDKGTPSNPDPDKDNDNDIPGKGGDTDRPNNPPGKFEGPLPGPPGPPFIGGPIPHPPPKPFHCPPGYHHSGRICERDVVINVHTHYTGGSSSGGSHSLSDKCYNTIKAAWLGKIQRGYNDQLDNTIDDCLNIS